MPFNLDGYVCLGASLTWGALGVIVLKWGNPLLLALYSLVPRGIWVVVLLAALVVFCVDLVGTLLAMAGLRYGCRKPSGKPDRPRRHVDP